MLGEDDFFEGSGHRVLPRERAAEVEEHLDAAVARVDQPGPEEGQPTPQRESRIRQHGMGIKNSNQRDIHHESLDFEFLGRQAFILQIARDNAGVMRPVPPGRRRFPHEVDPVSNAVAAGIS
ncbi:hypothetical protein WKI71_01325 [Streptomyces sp. MS1.AVA.1]|uniref:Uncharacterized protein n=1 Tax=Streptomyces machairae TaxID=3134109 RepID=A0ABU8UFL7_9ACTN